MRKKLKRFFSGMLALSLVLASVPSMSIKANADVSGKLSTDEDFYILNFAGNDIENYEDYDYNYLYPSPHYNGMYVDEDGDGINESDWNYTGHKTYNMINTTKITGTLNGPNASEPAYCLDAITDGVPGFGYRRVNLEDSTYFDDNVAGRLRAIMSRVFPFKKDMDKLASSSNAWLASDSDAVGKYDPIVNLTETECITATQSAIWTLTNGVEVYDTYLDTDQYRSGFRGKSLYPEYMNQAETQYTESNIETLYYYLISLKPEKAKNTVITSNSFTSVDANVEKEADGGYSVIVSATVDAQIDGETELEFLAKSEFVESGLKVTSRQNVVDGKQKYSTVFGGLTHTDVEDFTVELIIEGIEESSGVFLYEPLNGREMSQTMGGYSSWTLPVRAKTEITVDNNTEIDISGTKIWDDESNEFKETESEQESSSSPEESSSQETTTAPEEPSSQETTFTSETTTRVDDDDDDNEPETTLRTTAPETTAPEITVPETSPTPTSPTVIYRGVEIPQEILDAYPGKTLDELFDMGVLGAFFENVPTGLLPATNDMSIIWTAMSVLSAIGLAGVSVIGKKRDDEE